MTYIVPSGALNSTQTKPNLGLQTSRHVVRGYAQWNGLVGHDLYAASVSVLLWVSVSVCVGVNVSVCLSVMLRACKTKLYASEWFLLNCCCCLLQRREILLSLLFSSTKWRVAIVVLFRSIQQRRIAEYNLHREPLMAESNHKVVSNHAFVIFLYKVNSVLPYVELQRPLNHSSL